MLFSLPPVMSINAYGEFQITPGTSNQGHLSIYGCYFDFTPKVSPNPWVMLYPITRTRLANANAMWRCISENLPGGIPADVQEMIEEVQAHMVNIISLSNSIYLNGELVKAINIMERINEALGCGYA
ncbi:MAG: hypothetical protein ACXQTP_01985 [Candidatus Methanofastidiosia archaeon]